MTVFLLLIYVGMEIGYISVPDLPSEDQCKAVYHRIAMDHAVGFRRPRDYSCIPYTKAKP